MRVEGMTRHRPKHGPRWLLQALFVLFATLLIGCAGQAQTGDEPLTQATDPARLGVAEGPVFFWRQGQSEWASAQVNTAVVAGDALRTGAKGTAELQVGPRDFVRLTADTQVNLVGHEPRLMQFRVEAGLASFDLRGVETGHLIEIDTANATVMVAGRGYYRVDVRGNATRLVVRQGGRATLSPIGAGRGHEVAAGEEIVVAGGDVQRRPAPAADAWDRWNDDRSDYHASAQSRQYIPEGVYGAADLDANGTWRQTPDYGPVWVPAVASGWSPYSAGDWRWDPYYGWTWVDEAAWGWSTSHYGRWVYLDNYWAWTPGPRVVRPIYAPALVAFFRRSGGVSWVALGWGEPLVPWWGRPGFRGTAWWGGWGGPRIVNNVVVHNHVSDIGSIVYRNTAVSQAVIGMRHEDFGRRRVHDSRLPPPGRDELVVIRGDHPVRPDHPAGMRATARTPEAAALPMPGRQSAPFDRREHEVDGRARPMQRFPNANQVPPGAIIQTPSTRAAPTVAPVPAPVAAPATVAPVPRPAPAVVIPPVAPAPRVETPRPAVTLPWLEPRPEFRHEMPPTVIMPRPMEQRPPEIRPQPRPEFRREMPPPGGMNVAPPRAVLPSERPAVHDQPRYQASEPRGGHRDGPDFGRGGFRRERE
jgi:hypothetical protein